MNAVTFNGYFDGWLKADPGIRLVLQSPLIEWNVPTPELVRKMEDRELVYDKTGSLILPFPRFRVAGHFDMTSKEMFRMLVYQHPAVSGLSGMMTTAVIHRQLEGQHVVMATEFKLNRQDGQKQADCSMLYKTSVLCDGKIQTYGRVHPARPPGVDSYLMHFSGITATCLEELAGDFVNPHLYLCKKSPPLPQGKTVIWQQQREHYVFIHKTHSANSKAAKGKKVIQHDGNTVDRMAHSRRAHDRLLKSDRFKYKKGQRIRVRATWVGPEEWTDHSGQIYRIVKHDENGKPVI